MSVVLDCVQTHVTPEQNDQLTQEFTAEEVKGALFSMHSDKSLGPDGMNPAFYQRFWNIIGNDIVATC